MFTSISKFRKELTSKFAKVKASDIQDEALKIKCRKLKNKQGGFTLLELLVVVSILAAIAGTATLALQDTDARAAAAAHVAMMDELNKGIRTYKALNKAFPNNFDSLLMTTNVVSTTNADLGTLASIGFAGTIGGDNHATLAGAHVFGNEELSGGAAATAYENPLIAIEDVEMFPVRADVIGALDEVGITSVRVVNEDAAPDDSAGLNCLNLPELISGRTNAVVAGNLFVGESVNGCGVGHDLAAGNHMVFWTGGSERITGNSEDTTSWNADGNTAFAAFGVGPASNLFDTTTLAGMTSVPVYRHVSKDQYNRFIAIYKIGNWQLGECTEPAGTVTDNVSHYQGARSQVACEALFDHDDDGGATAELAGTWDGAANTVIRAEQVQLVSVVDGAGDTKEEELGEWDGTRNTI